VFRVYLFLQISVATLELLMGVC